MSPPKCPSSVLSNQAMIKFTKAQREILDAIANGEEVNNISQRMRAIQPLLDAGIVEYDNRQDNYGLWYTHGLRLL